MRGVGAQPGQGPGLEQWPTFMEQLRARMEQGAREYGSSSFTRPTSELFGELEEEALDIAGWGFFAWCRIRKLKAAVEQGEQGAG